MKRILLFISVILAIILANLMPATALAAKPTSFSASGKITYIELGGSVFPAGDSGRWEVVSRYLKGIFLGRDIDGPFTLTYKANVTSKQAGNLHGTLTAGKYVLEVNAKIQPLEVVEVSPGVYLPKLTIGGQWTFIEGAKGQGNFNAYLIFIPLGEHVGTVQDSSFTMTGQWQP